MDDLKIDLYSMEFWEAFGLAFLLLNSVKGPSRRFVLALINLGFLTRYLKSGMIVLLVGLLAAYLILKVSEGRFRRVALGLGGVATLSLFLFHKAPAFFEPDGSLRVAGVLVTIGFSYVALRLIEVGRAVAEGRHRAPDLVSLVNYLLPFHMLAAGPIQSYDDFISQPDPPPVPRVRDSVSHLEFVAAGLFKKYVLANLIERLFLTGYRVGGPYFFLEAQLNYVWVYLDFSAYSDIALGLGGLMGVATPVNFNRPYLARNIIDYWDRWHISLSLFIRRNIFIPLQLWLTRRTDGRHPLKVVSLSFLVSFLLCGLWHSLSLNWLLWGAAQALGLIVCNLYKYYLGKKLGRAGVKTYLANPGIRAVATLLTFEFIAATLVIASYPREFLSWSASR